MTDGKCTDTHIRNGIGKITQHRLEQFEERLHEEHHLSLFHLLMLLCHQISQRFLEYEQEHRNPQENYHHDITRNLMSRHIKHDRQHQESIEHQSRDSVVGK